MLCYCIYKGEIFFCGKEKHVNLTVFDAFDVKNVKFAKKSHGFARKFCDLTKKFHGFARFLCYNIGKRGVILTKKFHRLTKIFCDFAKKFAQFLQKGPFLANFLKRKTREVGFFFCKPFRLTYVYLLIT